MPRFADMVLVGVRPDTELAGAAGGLVDGHEGMAATAIVKPRVCAVDKRADLPGSSDASFSLDVAQQPLVQPEVPYQLRVERRHGDVPLTADHRSRAGGGRRFVRAWRPR